VNITKKMGTGPGVVVPNVQLYRVLGLRELIGDTTDTSLVTARLGWDPVTVASAAAPDASLRSLFYGGVVVLPVIAAYTIGVYWVFRGKIGKVAKSDAGAGEPLASRRSAVLVCKRRPSVVAGASLVRPP
jgi:hypothetical protein